MKGRRLSKAARADHHPVRAEEGRAQANHRRVRAGGRGGPDLGGVLLCPGVSSKVSGLFREDPPPTPELQIRVGPEFHGTWLYPSTRSDLGNPPTESCDTNEYWSWLRTSKAVPAANSFTVILRSNTASTVIVEGMSVQVRDRRPPLAGILLECAIGGGVLARSAARPSIWTAPPRRSPTRRPPANRSNGSRSSWRRALTSSSSSTPSPRETMSAGPPPCCCWWTGYDDRFPYKTQTRKGRSAQHLPKVAQRPGPGGSGRWTRSG